MAVCLTVSGCLPSGSYSQDEQREAHFIMGKSRVRSLDYDGAIEAFEKALEVNPRSASAHFELGQLYENNRQDYAAAIYHYERFLQLRPDDERAGSVKLFLLRCKQELAKTVSLAPMTQSMSRDLERLTAENKELRQKLQAWQDFYNANAARFTAGTPAPETPAPQPTPAPQTVVTPTPPPVSPPIATPPPARNPVVRSPAPAPARPAAAVLGTYAVKRGDTPAAIARKYGVKLESLLAANPGLDARHMKVGQTLNIPAH
ncbi:MAG TPA: tetratricopeptide repeat protein [Dongiaceae bacterium]|nr:tetratricopeptide repeat protein [Dongiaceae bacterium]